MLYTELKIIKKSRERNLGTTIARVNQDGGLYKRRLGGAGSRDPQSSPPSLIHTSTSLLRRQDKFRYRTRKRLRKSSWTISSYHPTNSQACRPSYTSVQTGRSARASLGLTQKGVSYIQYYGQTFPSNNRHRCRIRRHGRVPGRRNQL